MTIKWYKKFYENPKEIKNFALSQIKYYENKLVEINESSDFSWRLWNKAI